MTDFARLPAAIRAAHGIDVALDAPEASATVAEAYGALVWYDGITDDAGSLVPCDPLLSVQEVEAAWSSYAPPGMPLRKLVVVDRLIAANKLTDALAALDADATKKARWDAAVEIEPDDPDVVGFIAAIGADPAVILAPEA